MSRPACPGQRPGRNVPVKTREGQKMKCIYCGKVFEPDPPRRQVCSACIKKRPAHLRERYASRSGKRERRESSRTSLHTQGEGDRPNLPPVSVGKEPDAAGRHSRNARIGRFQALSGLRAVSVWVRRFEAGKVA